MRARNHSLASALVPLSAVLVCGARVHAQVFVPAQPALPATPVDPAQLFDPATVRTLGASTFGPPADGGPAPAVTRCVAGEVTGDARLDALIAGAGDVWLAWAPGRYDALPRIAQTATDVALLPSDTGTRAATALTLDAQNGLVAHVHDATTESFTSLTLGSAAWRNASELGVAALDTLGWSDLYALGANRLSVLALTAIDTGTPVESTFALAEPALGIVALDWSGTANREFAISTASGIELRRLTGAGAAPLPIAGAGARLAVLARPAGGYERLAAVTRAGSVDVLHVAGFGLATFTLALGDQDVSRVAAADLDLDGRTDLVLTRRASGNPLYLLQHADGTFALDASSGVVDLGAPYAHAGTAPLALGDFDGDGDTDVLAYVLARHAFRLASNVVHVARHSTPAPQARELVETITDMALPAEFHLALAIGAPLQPLAGATHFELTVWRQRAPDAGPELVATQRVLVPRDPAPLDGLWRTQLAFADAEDAAQLHEIEVREIAVGPQGELVAGGPSAVECYSADLGRLESFAGVQSIDYAEALALVPWTVILPPGVLGATSRLDTGDVPLGDIPKFDDEDAEETDTQLPNPKGGG